MGRYYMKWYIYNVNTLDNQTFNRFFGLLTPKRKEYVLSLKKEKSRKLTVTGEMLAKNAISVVLFVVPNGSFCYAKKTI